MNFSGREVTGSGILLEFSHYEMLERTATSGLNLLFATSASKIRKDMSVKKILSVIFALMVAPAFGQTVYKYPQQASMEAKMFFIGKRFFLIISMIIMMPIFMIPTLVTAEDLTVVDISTKKMSVDSSGDVWFSVRAVIRNNTSEPQEVRLIAQAVDSEGYELKSVVLRGRIPANSPDSITDKTWMPDKDYRAISKWKFEIR